MKEDKKNTPNISPARQIAAVVAALTMSAMLVLCMLAIGGSAYLSSHGVAVVLVPAIVATLL